MKAIAEYFRDLASDDRYFGAEPATPDAEMLARIAERETQKRVEAKLGNSGVVLRQSEAEPQIGHVASEAPAYEPTYEAEQPADVDHDAESAESVAAKLQRIRAVVARNQAVEPAFDAEEIDPLVEGEDTASDDVFAAPAAEEFVAEDIAEEPVFEEEAAAEDFAPVEEEEVAAEPEADEELSSILDRVSDDEPVTSEEIAEEIVEQADTGSVLEELATETVEEFEEEVIEEEPVAEIAEPEPVETVEERAVEESVAEEAPEAVEEAVEEATDDSDDPYANARRRRPRTSASEAAERARARALRMKGGDAAAVAAPAAVAATVTDAVEDEVAEEPVAEFEPIDETETVEAPEFEEIAEEPEVVVAESEADSDDVDLAEEEAAKSLLEGGQNDFQSALAEIEQEALTSDDEGDSEGETEEDADAFTSETIQSDEIVEDAAESETSEEDDNENDEALDAALSAALMGQTAPVRNRRGRDILSHDSEEEEASVERLMEETNSQFDNPETSRRRSAISHLRAAVAATVADRLVKTDPLGESGDKTDAYRADLAEAVIPRADADAEKDEVEEIVEKPEQPAPLMLVSEQRIDTPEDDVAPQSNLGASVRPRRVGGAAPALREVNEDFAQDAEDDADENIFSESTRFDEFARSMGATELPDLLEAAAAYTIYVEGCPHFSRPQAMRLASEFLGDDKFVREDGLRSFGQLLRQERIVKLKRGQFTIAEDTRFKPEARAAGE
ncbi:hypothetical protein [Aliiroseovarius sp. YM-037]|uniref:hypothetical protein n=1 Tax=Aliiroseovarius sp. YM-037 TaxID=3341728 RepID=UPI003A7FC168